MKRLLIILILTLCFKPWTKADDITDFQIEGMSIGDSLLDYFSKSEIDSFKKNYYKGNKKYFRLNIGKLNSNFNEYERIDFEVKNNDKNFKLEAINGSFNYKKNIEECYSRMKKIVGEISFSLEKSKTRSYVFEYPDNGGKSDVTDFVYTTGVIRIWCTNYSKKNEEIGYADHLGVVIQSINHFNWIANEAHK